MAGLEQLEIHSKSYLVRWVKVEEGHTISWSIQPHKKSINFGIFKHPGINGNATLQLPVPSENAQPSVPHTEPGFDLPRRVSSSKDKSDQSTAQEQLRAKGFISIQWLGKCEADKVSMGKYDVPVGQGGMYGLIFDNTFSKQLSKTATFVLLTYPSNAPPHATHHLQNFQGASVLGSLNNVGKRQSPKMVPLASDSVDSLQSNLGIPNNGSRTAFVPERQDSENGIATYHVGVLQKRKRKWGQGYARRFFSLDFATCTLSYYYSRNSSALRGAIPLSLAAVAADERRREISIDSGAEVWHLRAGNAKDFNDWTTALERASRTARGIDIATPDPESLRVKTTAFTPPVVNQDEEREWEQVEALVSRCVGIRDAVRRLSKDTAPGNKKEYRLPLSLGLGTSTSSPTIGEEHGDYFGSNPEKKTFWRRKSSAPATPQLFGRSMSTQLAVPATSVTITANGSVQSPPSKSKRREEASMHEHCEALLNDLDAVLLDFSTLLANSKRRRVPAPMSASRVSMDSTSTGDFYDAESGDPNQSQVLMIDRRSDEDNQPSDVEDDFVTDDASSVSSAEDARPLPRPTSAASLFPVKPKSLDPLPLPIIVKRRNVIPHATTMPPSLISFLRKNVGKDLSTISMPVSANEPISLLQRTAEQLEYAQLLDRAASHKDPAHRLLNVTAFAVSQFSSGRARERAVRKPFNPLLGETFELVRTDKEIPGGFRLLVEKVSHRPVRVAIQAESSNWSFSQSPAPTQKFWGKSAELITQGRVRMTLRLSDGSEELYSWNVATAFLRNVVMGEKYVEPVGTMTVMNETTGAKACVEFKQKSMFGGRSEDVQVESYLADGSHTGLSLVGTWTTSLRISEAGKSAGAEIWRVGELVDSAPQRYGLTTFAASLNEITEVERGKLPVTDCRLRPDQRFVETGNLDEAERWKTLLEEKQRVRRKEMEARGEVHKPRWFVRVEGGDEGEEVWRLRGGKEGYWEERKNGYWTGCEDIFGR